MKSLGYTTLTNESARVLVGKDTLTVVGLADFQSLSFPGDQKTDFVKGFSGVIPGKGFCLAIIHQPKEIEEAVRRGADLILSGHTHGGQFFPGTLVIKWAQKYVAGLYDLKGAWLYVGRGTGAWGPPMRLGARGEIAVLTLEK
jgi:predicted MPP superfamily phosphohydrolase